MTQVVTPPEPLEDPAQAWDVVVDEDPTPLARLLARRLARVADEDPGRAWASVVHRGAVVVRSHDTPQIAAVLVTEDGCTVTDSLPEVPDAELVVDIGSRCSLVGEPAGERSLWSVVLDALHAPPPPWREEAGRFWDATRDIAGIPDVLVARAQEADGTEELRVGSGSTEYVIAGTGDQLAGIFSGIDDLLGALEAGVTVQGTLADLSVMTAASWRVRYGF